MALLRDVDLGCKWHLLPRLRPQYWPLPAYAAANQLRRDRRRDSPGVGAQARPWRPHALQRRPTRAVLRHHCRDRAAGPVWAGDLETRAVLGAGVPVL